MYFQIIQPSGILKNYIRQFSLMETDATDPVLKERVVPVENMQLLFHYRKPFVICNSGADYIIQPRSFVSGLSNSWSDVVTQGESGVIFVEFRPAGACRFFRFPLLDLENRSIDLADVFCSEIRQVEDKLSCALTVGERIKVIEQFLLNHFIHIPQYDEALINKGILIIGDCSGKITASELAERLSVTSRTLERKFTTYLGMSPGKYSKLVRFRHILGRFKSSKDISLTEHAYRSGYFDQSHFIRDFKMYSGYTPGEFISVYPEIDISGNFCS